MTAGRAPSRSNSRRAGPLFAVGGDGRGGLTVAAAVATAAACAPFAVLYEQLTWIFPVLLMVAVIGLGGYVGRRMMLPAVAVTALAAAAGAVAVTFLFVPASERILWVLPGPAAVAWLRALLDTAMSDVRGLAVPVPVTQGLLLLLVGGVGLVAVVVDLFAVTLRLAALAALPLLLMVACAVAISPTSVGWVAYLCAAAGFAVLLLADGNDRSRRWGRSVRLATDAPSREWGNVTYAEELPLASTGRRIVVAAIGVGLVIPILLPTMEPTRWMQRGAGSTGLLGGGLSPITYNPIVSLRGDLSTTEPVALLTTRPMADGYLRTTSLDRFDGATWSSSGLTGSDRASVRRGIPLPPGVSEDAETTEISISVSQRLSLPWLPAPFPLTQVRARGDWRYDEPSQTVFSRRTTTRGLDYTVRSARVDADAAALRAVPAPSNAMRLYTQLPTLPISVVTTANEVTKDVGTAYDRALAIQEWLRSTFTYDLSVPTGHGVSDLVDFLEGRRGFCEQFAATMAIFARLKDIPARVAIGFTPGTLQDDGSSLVTTHDAHAWPELYFEGFGWLAFEPTPVGEGRATPPSYAQASPEGGGTGAGPGTEGPTGPGRGATEDPTNRRDERVGTLGADGGDATAALEDAAAADPPVAWLAWLAVVLAVAAGVPAVVRVVRRHRRTRAARHRGERESAHLLWAELRDDAADLGYSWPPSATPRSVAVSLAKAAGLDETSAAALSRLAQAQERAAYSTVQPGGSHVPDVATVRRGLARSVPWSRRVRARLMPRSVLLDMRRAGAVVADLLDAVDRAVGAVGRRLRRSTG